MDENKQGKRIQGKEVFDYNVLQMMYVKNQEIIVLVANHLFMASIVQQLEQDGIRRIAIVT